MKHLMYDMNLPLPVDDVLLLMIQQDDASQGGQQVPSTAGSRSVTLQLVHLVLQCIV